MSCKSKLIIVTGSPCVGKTTVADRLFETYENSAHFDGDWAWRVNPFSISDPRLRNGDKIMSFALSTYLNSNFDYVIFSSVVVSGEKIREAVLKDITAKDYTVIAFTLTCSEKTLAERHKKRGDTGDVDFQWLRHAPHPGDYVINTDNKTVDDIVAEIKCIVDAKKIVLETKRLHIKPVNVSGYDWEIAEKGTSELVGKIAFFDIDKKLCSCTLGFHTEENHRNKGYMTEALSCVLRFMMLDKGFNRISGGHQADNPASGKVMAGAGMKYEGTFRQDFMNKDGTVVDSVMYSMIKQDLK
ncbi:MAG: GNAT family N-acetyltransferase [Defluviitaleaceae bacterium]|nr:GNAT family N-acetyltransferase [Defluviitaleaceae bacterium]